MPTIQSIIDGLEDLRAKLSNVEDMDENYRNELDGAIESAIDVAENAAGGDDEDASYDSEEHDDCYSTDDED